MGRLRTIVGSKEIVKNNKYYFSDTKVKQFNKFILEIGCGKGDFIIENAIKNVDVLYIGYEKYATVLYKALKKIENISDPINNICFINDDAKQINLYFDLIKFDKIHLNFSDPWPKKRHIKNRLTSNNFLDLYKKILKKESTVEFKTDNESLFLFTNETLLERNDIHIIYKTTDLYKNLNDNFNLNNIASEYEKKYREIKNINKIIFKFIN